jgi:uncharacterized protein YbjT (DUF2867 family)
VVHREDERAQSLREMGVDAVISELQDLDDMHRIIEGCGVMYLVCPFLMTI